MGMGEWEVAHEWNGVRNSALSEGGGSGESGVGAGGGGEGDAAEVDDYGVVHHEVEARMRYEAALEERKEAEGRAGVEVRARRVVGAGASAGLEATALEQRGAAAHGKEVARGLQLGSADPHMVREPSKVQEPWRRRGGTFSINRLDPADGRELCLRAFPEMNPVPSTEAREAGSGQMGGAPVITAIEQVVPVATLQKI